MSRTGKQPITIPKEITVKIEGGSVSIKGPKGALEMAIPQGINVEMDNDTLLVKRKNDTKPVKSLHGTIRILIHNMVVGVTKGFKKELDIIGIGYKAQIKGAHLVLNLGFSHPIEMAITEGLKITTPTPNRIAIEGIDKQKVGEFAARVRRVYPPEPYKGKGVRHLGEFVRKKLGKALAK
jgi:large subunit ribosomal protein L6